MLFISPQVSLLILHLPDLLPGLWLRLLVPPVFCFYRAARYLDGRYHGLTNIAVTCDFHPWQLRSYTWMEWPIAKPDESTSINSGRSAGKQATFRSFITWLTMPPFSFTPGQISALMKCIGTFM